MHLIPDVCWCKTVIHLIPDVCCCKTVMHLIPDVCCCKTVMHLIPDVCWCKTVIHLIPDACGYKTVIHLIPDAWGCKTVMHLIIKKLLLITSLIKFILLACAGNSLRDKQAFIWEFGAHSQVVTESLSGRLIRKFCNFVQSAIGIKFVYTYSHSPSQDSCLNNKIKLLYILSALCTFFIFTKYQLKFTNHRLNLIPVIICKYISVEPWAQKLNIVCWLCVLLIEFQPPELGSLVA